MYFTVICIPLKVLGTRMKLSRRRMKLSRRRMKVLRRRMKVSRRRMKVSRTRIQILVLQSLKRITFLCGKLRKDNKFLGMSLGLQPREIPWKWSSFLSFPHKNVILFKVSRTRICILVLETFILLLETFILLLESFILVLETFILVLQLAEKYIIILYEKRRKDNKFQGMSPGLSPRDIPRNLSSFLSFPHKIVILFRFKGN